MTAEIVDAATGQPIGPNTWGDWTRLPMLGDVISLGRHLGTVRVHNLILPRNPGAPATICVERLTEGKRWRG